jgi:hypothetical protein
METREKMALLSAVADGERKYKDPFKGHDITVTGWTRKIERDNPF